MRWIDEVLELALTEMPAPLKDAGNQDDNKAGEKSTSASKSKKTETTMRH